MDFDLRAEIRASLEQAVRIAALQKDLPHANAPLSEDSPAAQSWRLVLTRADKETQTDSISAADELENPTVRSLEVERDRLLAQKASLDEAIERIRIAREERNSIVAQKEENLKLLAKERSLLALKAEKR